MTSKVTMNTAPNRAPERREVDVFLAVHHVERPSFVEVVRETADHLAECVRLGAPKNFALMQKLLHQSAQFDRLAITRYFSPDEKGRIRFLRLDDAFRRSELFTHVARGVLSLQTAQTLNGELWMSCMELEGTPSGKEIRARAIFLSGCILVLPNEDLDFEASLRVPGGPGFKSTKNGEPAALGVALIPSPTTQQQHLDASGAVESARQILQVDLDRRILTTRYRVITRPGKPTFQVHS